MIDREDVAEAWKAAKDKGFWKAVLVAAFLASQIYTWAIKPAQDWFTGERKQIRKEIHDAIDAGVKFEAEARAAADEEIKTEQARHAQQISISQQQNLALWREQVRFVAASRKDDVSAILADFEDLVKPKPERPALPPDQAAKMALKVRHAR